MNISVAAIVLCWTESLLRGHSIFSCSADEMGKIRLPLLVLTILLIICLTYIVHPVESVNEQSSTMVNWILKQNIYDIFLFRIDPIKISSFRKEEPMSKNLFYFRFIHKDVSLNVLFIHNTHSKFRNKINYIWAFIIAILAKHRVLQNGSVGRYLWQNFKECTYRKKFFYIVLFKDCRFPFISTL